MARTVWILEGGDEGGSRVFATREAAMRVVESGLRARYKVMIDPYVDVIGAGGVDWRVKHYTDMGLDAYIAEELRRGIWNPDEIELEGWDDSDPWSHGA